jgi:hypothetical protein
VVFIGGRRQTFNHIPDKGVEVGPNGSLRRRASTELTRAATSAQRVAAGWKRLTASSG